MFHNMEDIQKFHLKDKILVNMKQHRYDIQDKEICLIYHRNYIDVLEVHYKLNIAYHTIDN